MDDLMDTVSIIGDAIILDKHVLEKDVVRLVHWNFPAEEMQ